MRRSTLPPHYQTREHNLDVFLGERFGVNLRVLPEHVKNSLNPLLCDASLLDVLAKKANTDFWSDGLREKEKRQVIFYTMKIKRIKGTIAALKEVLSFLDINANVAEAWEYEGDDFHFKILINKNNQSISAKNIVLLKKLIYEYKNARSVLDEILLSYHTVNSMNVATGVMASTRSVAKQRTVYEAQSLAMLGMASGAMAHCKAFATNQKQGL